MKSKELTRLGIPPGNTVKKAATAVSSARKAKVPKALITQLIRQLVARPEDFLDHDHFGELATDVKALRDARRSFAERNRPAPLKMWGKNLDQNSIEQIENACRLPVSVRGALMPDAHLGYGLPIGGVLATENAVIPYAVGVDIACRVKLTVLDLPLDTLDRKSDRLERAIGEETRFGLGCTFKQRRAHPVMDEDWNLTRLTAHLKNKAWAQLGTSGSGNHFVEFGSFDIEDQALGLEPGRYVALLTHSGSRGAGATIANHYSKLAMELHPELPRELRHLAWLDLDRSEGEEYWQAMELMGLYASANHACIHRHIQRHLGAKVLLDLENHHNFAWKEVHDGRSVVVHRKGATPAGKGVIGIIPGSMASPTYVVEGMGNPESMNSAAHGAGRVMSRKKAKLTYRWNHVRPLLASRGVKVLSAGLDEVPQVYKDIDEVMAAQADLVRPLARFFPTLVKMAPDGEKPED